MEKFKKEKFSWILQNQLLWGHAVTALTNLMSIFQFHFHSRAGINKGRERYTPLFFENQKKCHDFGKNALIIFIYGLTL